MRAERGATVILPPLLSPSPEAENAAAISDHKPLAARNLHFTGLIGSVEHHFDLFPLIAVRMVFQ